MKSEMNEYTGLSPDAERALIRLRDILKKLDSAAIAFSGGIDSTLLLKAALDTPGLKTAAFTVKSILFTEEEIAEAAEFTSAAGVNHYILEIDITAFPDIVSNPPLRCYHCKKAVFGLILQKSRALGFNSLLEGSHHDDDADYRPGIKALKELAVLSPLKEAGFTKKLIREAAEYLKIINRDRPSSPCLATRIPYGTPLDYNILHAVKGAEDFLRSMGFSNVRVRAHGDIARIETDEKMFAKFLEEDIRNNIRSELESLGFSYITLDIAGYRTGSMNLTIDEEVKNWIKS